MLRHSRINMTDILIVGTGALGTLFAARLAGAGHHVTMLGTWQDGIAAVQQNGVRIVDAAGIEQRFNVRATDNPHDCDGSKYALVLVKAWQTERAALQLRDCLAHNGLALTLQNGLGNHETLSLHLGLNRVTLGVSTTGATLLRPGVARAGGEGVISLQQDQALGPIEAALKSARFNVQVVNDAQSLVWGKLVVNAAINPLTALLNISNGELLNRPSARELMGRLAREVAEVARLEKVQLPFADPVSAVEDVARRTAANHSSMLQDVLRNAPTEIDAICGAVVSKGVSHEFEASVNRTCWSLVRALHA